MKIEVLGFQAKKDNPSHPHNKIAFTLDGHLCFVVVPEVAHALIDGASRDASVMMDFRHKEVKFESLDQDTKFHLVGLRLASRPDIATIAKRA